jgi:hypothetical protein
MKHKIIPSSIGMSSVMLFFALALAFIHLSTKVFNDDISILGKTVQLPHTNLKQADVQSPYGDVLFQYNMTQDDVMKIKNYEISLVSGEGKVTPEELEQLLNCYHDSECTNAKVPTYIGGVVQGYKHFLIKDDMIVLYGLKLDEQEYSVEEHLVIIGDNMLIDIIDPVPSRVNSVYALGNNTNSKQLQKIIEEEKVPEVVNDLASLKRVAQSIEIKKRETQNVENNTLIHQ